MKILISDDDINSARFIRGVLESEGHSCEVVYQGADAVHFCLDHPCDLLVLDRLMPGLDGLSVVRTIRAAGNDLPVLFVTALTSVQDRVEGLNAGGDDYLGKPFHRAELIARVNALTRRSFARTTDHVLKVHDLELNLLSRQAQRSGKPIDLKAKEFVLLEYFMRNAGRVVTRTMLLERIWNFNFDPQTSVVETHISRLRRKIDKPFPEPLLQTIKNAGYLMRAGASLPISHSPDDNVFQDGSTTTKKAPSS